MSRTASTPPFTTFIPRQTTNYLQPARCSHNLPVSHAAVAPIGRYSVKKPRSPFPPSFNAVLTHCNSFQPLLHEIINTTLNNVSSSTSHQSAKDLSCGTLTVVSGGQLVYALCDSQNKYQYRTSCFSGFGRADPSPLRGRRIDGPEQPATLYHTLNAYSNQPSPHHAAQVNHCHSKCDLSSEFCRWQAIGDRGT